jgi:hypothetical protein
VPTPEQHTSILKRNNNESYKHHMVAGALYSLRRRITNSASSPTVPLCWPTFFKEKLDIRCVGYEFLTMVEVKTSALHEVMQHKTELIDKKISAMYPCRNWGSNRKEIPTCSFKKIQIHKQCSILSTPTSTSCS